MGTREYRWRNKGDKTWSEWQPKGMCNYLAEYPYGSGKKVLCQFR